MVQITDMSITATEPRSALEFQLQQIWEELLDCGPIGINDDFFDLGGDSLLAMSVLAKVAKTTGHKLPVAGMLLTPTIRELAESLHAESDGKNWSPLVPIRAKGTKPPIFLMHPAGGNALCYLQLTQNIPEDQPVYALQSAGIDGVHEPSQVIEEIAAEYVEAIRRFQPEGPYSVGGWSFGGLVAFEVAQQLRAAGQELSTVAIIDSGLLYSFAVLRTVLPENDLGIFDLMRLPKDEQLVEFRARTASARLVPEDASQELVERIFAVFIANMRATFNYRPQPYDGKLTLLVAGDSIVKTRHTPQRDWKSLCTDMEVHSVSGTHLTMVHQPHVADLGSKLAACLQNQSEPALGRSKPR